MLTRLAEVLGFGDPLVNAARRAEPERFSEVFRRSSLRFLSISPAFADGMESKGATQEQVLAYIEKAAADLAARQTFEPFGYVGNGRTILPLFTHERYAKEFVSQYVEQVRRIMPFQVLTVEGSALTEVLSQFDVVVLNDKTPQACRVLDGHLSALKDRGA